MKKAKKSRTKKKTATRSKPVIKAIKSVRKTVEKSVQRRANLRPEVIDQVLLRLAARPYNKIMKQIESGRKRLNDERRIALELGTRILEKAKEVRDSLIQRTRATRGE